MNVLSVGKEVLSLCTPCKSAMAHTIITIKTMKTMQVPGKVLCKACHKTHAYKDPHAKAKTKSATSRINSKLLRQKKSKDYWLKTISQSDSSIHKSYAIDGVFELNDIIVHAQFGIGIIEKLMDTNKIFVLFKAEEKILIHNQ